MRAFGLTLLAGQAAILSGARVVGALAETVRNQNSAVSAGLRDVFQLFDDGSSTVVDESVIVAGDQHHAGEGAEVTFVECHMQDDETDADESIRIVAAEQLESVAQFEVIDGLDIAVSLRGQRGGFLETGDIAQVSVTESLLNGDFVKLLNCTFDFFLLRCHWDSLRIS